MSCCLIWTKLKQHLIATLLLREMKKMKINCACKLHTLEYLFLADSSASGTCISQVRPLPYATSQTSPNRITCACMGPGLKQCRHHTLFHRSIHVTCTMQVSQKIMSNAYWTMRSVKCANRKTLLTCLKYPRRCILPLCAGAYLWRMKNCHELHPVSHDKVLPATEVDGKTIQ